MTLADLLKKQIIMLRSKILKTKHLVLAKPAPLTSVDNKMLNVGGLFKKADFDAKISEMEKKILLLPMIISS